MESSGVVDKWSSMKVDKFINLDFHSPESEGRNCRQSVQRHSLKSKLRYMKFTEHQLTT